MRTCIRLCRKRRSQFDMQGARRGPRNGRAGWIDYRPKCHVGRFVDEEGRGRMGGKAAAVGWPLGEEGRGARRDRQRRALGVLTRQETLRHVI